jgi:molybdopterin synthase sulfur carrier subunit
VIKVEFLGPIGKNPIYVEVSTLREIASKLNDDESIAQWLSSSAVAINDILVKDLDIALNDGDRVSILPPVCGG